MDNQDNNKRGGKRLNAGRKSGTGKFMEATEVIRVPSSQKSVIVDFLEAYQRKQTHIDLDAVDEFTLPQLEATPILRPLYSSKVRAGLPSPADDHVEKRLDVSEYLIDKIEETFFVTIVGESMRDAGLLSGDKAVVDRSKQASMGDIVLAGVDGEYTIKILGKDKRNFPRLIPANPDFSIIEITEDMQFEILGVVTGSFRRFR
jgi:DNA polymerase V